MKKTRQGIRDLDAEYGHVKKKKEEVPQSNVPPAIDPYGSVRCKDCHRMLSGCRCDK